ncbi:MAG: SDR family oxidoreductase [Spirochaetes bacterium]|nr:SDR family oxidoreductase [Spirochaetota bacterium]
MNDFNGKQALITGGACGIGRCIAEYFLKNNARVTIIDINEPVGKALSLRYDNLEFFCGDIAEKSTLEKLSQALKTPVDFLINNACIHRGGLLTGGSWDDFEYVQRVGVFAPYYLTKLLLSHSLLAGNASIINIASTRGFQSQADTESYSAAKGGILALTHAMSISLSGKARVNAISPGWIDTSMYHGAGEAPTHSSEDEGQHPAGRVGKPQDIAEMVMFLCDNERAGFITGENIVIDGGMSKLMIYHGDGGWKFDGALPATP